MRLAWCWPPQAMELRQAPKRSSAPGSSAHPHAIGFAAGTVEGIAWNNGIAVAEMIRDGRPGVLPRSQVAMRTTSAASCVIWERASIMSAIVLRQETPEKEDCGMITHLARQHATYPGLEISPDPGPGAAR
jgi:hypothetical protein